MLGAVVGGEEDPAVAVEVGDDQGAVGPAGVDVPAVAVSDPQAAGGDEAAVVTGGDDLVAPADQLGADREAVGFDVTGGDPFGPGPEGEGVDGGVVGGHDHDRPAGGPGGQPVGEGLVDHGLPGAAGDAAVGVIVIEDGLVALAQAERRLGFPGVGEAADLVEFGGPAVRHQEAEQAPGFDGAELAVVTDQDEFGVGRLDHVDQGSEIGAGQHGGLVHHHDLPGTKPAGRIAPAVGVVEEFGHGVGRDPRLFGQHAGGDGRHSQAPDGVAFPGPGVPGGAD